MPDIVYLEGLSLPLRLRREPRARRFSLRIEPKGEALLLTLPPGARLAEALAFAEGHRAWIEGRIKALPPRVPFAEGALIPLLGRLHRVCHAPGARRGVWREEGLILVSGDLAHLPRRLADYLKAEARRELVQRARAKARCLPESARPLRRVSLRDTSSRWGSCTTAGDLNFSWRLILAPEPVLDYVVAHEVAHLLHMNHSQRFWTTVARLTEEVSASRLWLVREGAGLLRFG